MNSKEQKVEPTSVNGNSTKPRVGGSTAKEQIECLNSIMLKFGKAHNLLAKTSLSKKEYQPISSLMTTAKVELFNFYIKIKETL